MNNWTSRSAVAVAAVALVGSAAATPAFGSGGGDDVRASGHCSASSTWKLKAKPDDGRLEVEAEVDSNRVGQTWTWRILHNGGVTARGTATTKAPSGSFSVQRRVVNAAGADHIGWRSHNGATGETCSGSLTI
jgi:uncharacterized membrane protein